MPPQQNPQPNFEQIEMLETNLQTLRRRLEEWDLKNISEELINSSADQDLLGTCEQLLAFELYDEFQRMQKKKQVTEIQLMECPSTRDLYLGFLQAKKNGKKSIPSMEPNFANKNSNQMLQDLKKERQAKKKARLLKIAAIVLAIVIVATTGFKFRSTIIRVLKMILNIK